MDKTINVCALSSTLDDKICSLDRHSREFAARIKVEQLTSLQATAPASGDKARTR